MIDHVIILAGGKGSRMNSSKSKPVHDFAGKPLIRWAYDLAKQCKPKFIHVVHGQNNQTDFAPLIPDATIRWVCQKKPNGTADALMCALDGIDKGQFLVIYADMPLVNVSDIQSMLNLQGELKLLSVRHDNPHGYGRLIHDDHGNPSAIIEEVDATNEQKQIQEVFTGILSGCVEQVKNWIQSLDNKNKQKEYLLTDIIAKAYKGKHSTHAHCSKNSVAFSGINSMAELVKLQRIYYEERAYEFLNKGVKICDPARFECQGEVDIGYDTEVRPNVSLMGPCSIGSNCFIGENAVLSHVQMGDHASIMANSVLDHTYLAAFSKVGPFAYCRNGTVIADYAEIGSFVETKQAYIGQRSKAKHLSYLGDVDIGKNCNIGAGVIVCNWDGKKKHKTVLGDHVFVGSDSQLIAPIHLEDYAFVAAGTCITKNVPKHNLSIGRTKQLNKPRPSKI